jgi:hypothetical protein
LPPGFKKWSLASAIASSVLIAGCGGSDSSDDDNASNPTPVDPGDGAGNATQLEGTWGGTIERASADASGTFETIEVTFDNNGNATEVVIAGSIDNLIANQESNVVTDQGRTLYAFSDIDGGRAVFFVDAASEHGAIATEGGAVAVLQKGSTSGSFANDDAIGSWAGRSLRLANNLDLNTLDQENVTGTFTAIGAAVQSNDLTFGDGADACADVSLNLNAPEPSFGVYDGTITGGSSSDCPGADSIPFDVYASYDANFLVVGFVGGEANSSCFVDDDCSLVVFERQ